MIVTRRRRKPFPWKRLLVPAIAIALIVGLFAWAPSREWIADRPFVGPVMKPFDAIAQQQTINSQNAQMISLERQLADARAQVTDRDRQIATLQTQLNDAQQQVAVDHAAPPAKGAPAQAVAAPASANDLAAQGTPDMRRTAQVWAAMDSEAAAKVVQRLPDAYVSRIFALMSPDSVGAILENLPAAYAARLTQEHPELRR